jgi:uncharacterized protein YlxW (UPF0749 family)
MADYYMSMVEEKPPKQDSHSLVNFVRTKTIKSRNNSLCQGKISLLEDKEIKCSNKLEQILKEEKELKKEKSALVERLSSLKKERDALADQVYGADINLREAQAMEVNKLKTYNQKEGELQR